MEWLAALSLCLFAGAFNPARDEIRQREPAAQGDIERARWINLHMRQKSLLIAAAAVLGFGGGQLTSAVAQTRTTEARQNVALNNGQTAKEIREDHFGSYAGGIGRGFMRSGGHTPYEWGTSRACAKMVHAKGISHSRI
jgi:hypothetical protein